MMAARPEIDPGSFKTAPNRAGATHFVHPEYVLGTLRKGIELYADLPSGFPKAAFIMFLVADVHPFVDGNGRIARIMMNADLVFAGSSTIIIPTVYREDYLLALRALTRRNRPVPLVEMRFCGRHCRDFCRTDEPSTYEERTDRAKAAGRERAAISGAQRYASNPRLVRYPSENRCCRGRDR